MPDRQRWLWAVLRLANRNRWTFFGSFAALTILGNAIASAIIFYAPSREPSDFFVPFAGMAVISIVAWTAIAVGNLLLERRGKALRTEAMIEMLAGARRFAQSLKPPTLTSVLVVAVILGSLGWFGGGFAFGLATGGTWLIGGMFVRWAWLKPSIPTWRLAVVSVMAGLGVLLLDLFKGFFRAGGTIKGAVTAGAVAGGVSFVFALWMRRLATPSAHPLSRLALEMRDRALTLARDDVPTDQAARDLLAAAKGSRPAAEMAWDILRKRPKDDLVNARAWALTDRAIRQGDWGWWPWEREVVAHDDK